MLSDDFKKGVFEYVDTYFLIYFYLYILMYILWSIPRVCTRVVYCLKRLCIRVR